MQSWTISSSSRTTTTTATTSCYSFEEFLQGWFRRQDHLLAEIATATKVKAGETTKRELIARALGHFEEYYEHKSRAAKPDVFVLFTPTWCSSFECAFFWITGFKPGTLLQLVTDSVHDLSPDQTRALDWLKRETMVEERSVANDLAAIQENIAAPPLRAVVTMAARQLDKQYSTKTSESLECLRVALEGVVANADCLRVTTVAKVVNSLSPTQCLRFLAAAIRLQQGMRSLRMQRDHDPQERGERNKDME